MSAWLDEVHPSCFLTPWSPLPGLPGQSLGWQDRGTEALQVTLCAWLSCGRCSAGPALRSCGGPGAGRGGMDARLSSAPDSILQSWWGEALELQTQRKSRRGRRLSSCCSRMGVARAVRSGHTCPTLCRSAASTRPSRWCSSSTGGRYVGLPPWCLGTFSFPVATLEGGGQAGGEPRVTNVFHCGRFMF